MAEYIEREAAVEAICDSKDEDINSFNPITKYNAIYYAIEAVPAADVVEASVLKEFAEDVIYQFGYKVNRDNGRLYLTAGGLSTLETAFDILGWEDPRPFPEGECEWDGCYNYATCGTPTSDGYKRVCYKHLCEIKAKMNEERRASDG